jgi:hypothetical protein
MKKEIILVVALAAALLFCLYLKKKQPTQPNQPQQKVEKKQEEKKQEEKPKEPQMTPWPAVRAPDPSLGEVLSDIDSHLPAGHSFRAANRITWAHETTHGIDAEIRNRHKTAGFYVLKDRAVLVPEPKTTLSAVAQAIPAGWRGQNYQLYLIRQQQHWDKEPLYVFEEWVAYTNGAACRKDLGMKDGSSEVEFACDFVGYALCLAKKVKEDCPGYDDAQFKAFLTWNCERLMGMYEGEAEERLRAIRQGDGEEIRRFARNYLGTDWCQKVLGF